MIVCIFQNSQSNIIYVIRRSLREQTWKKTSFAQTVSPALHDFYPRILWRRASTQSWPDWVPVDRLWFCSFQRSMLRCANLHHLLETSGFALWVRKMAHMFCQHELRGDQLLQEKITWWLVSRTRHLKLRHSTRCFVSAPGRDSRCLKT